MVAVVDRIRDGMGAFARYPARRTLRFRSRRLHVLGGPDPFEGLHRGAEQSDLHRGLTRLRGGCAQSWLTRVQHRLDYPGLPMLLVGVQPHAQFHVARC